MRYVRKIKKHSHVTIMLAVLIYLGNILCYTSSTAGAFKNNLDTAGKIFIGVDACKSCHKSICDSFGHTAHYFTSRPGSATSIKGSFEPGKNHFRYNPFMEVVLEKSGDSFTQTGLVSGQVLQAEAMDITIGSGRKGQTYLYWQGSELFQLPVSYYTPLNTWCNSPGFPTGFIKFYRQITSQCIECHATWAKVESESPGKTVFDRNGIVYGISCERCHGPGADHVVYHQAHPGDTKGKYIMNAGTLNRQQQLDACAFCHSGFRKQLQPSFSFSVGDKLDDFSTTGYKTDTSASLDVHGNQYGLLTASKCFKSSTMNCSSCHDVHNNEYNSPKIYSARCITCHKEGSQIACKFSPPAGIVLSDNCIDCHMPALPSGKILLEVSGNQSAVPDFVRTHKVDIYLKSTKEFVKKNKK